MTFRIALLVAVTVAQPLLAAPLPKSNVPEPLKTWVPWATYNQADVGCPRGPGGDETRHCNWPSNLRWTLSEYSGQFVYDVQTFGEGFVTLPGDATYWPLNVRLNGQSQAVVSSPGGENALPQIYVPAGRYRITGELSWRVRPTQLSVPADVALVQIEERGVVRDAQVNNEGEASTVWLLDRVSDDGEQQEVSIEVFRQITDSVPWRVTTRINLRVAGAPRETLLGPIEVTQTSTSGAPEATTTVEIGGSLPARLEPSGMLRVQLRPGEWQITVESLGSTPLRELTPPKASAPWPAQETWSFVAQPDLRQASVQGDAVDPRTHGVPSDWQQLPAYRMQQDSKLVAQELARGAAPGASDPLSVQRSMWLDFSGSGWTLRDTITGSLTGRTRLNMTTPFELGSVNLNGEQQLLTQHQNGVGLDLVGGPINLTAEARLPTTANDSLGWSSSFREVNLQVYLPPAWRLLGATGVDNVTDSWIASWSLWDIFLVVLCFAACAHLVSRKAGALLLVFLIIAYQEPQVPLGVWVNVFVALALTRAAGTSKLGVWMTRYLYSSLAALAIVAFGFATTQARLSLYPVLEEPNAGLGRGEFSSNIQVSEANFAPAEALGGMVNDEMQEPQRIYKKRAKAGDYDSLADKVMSDSSALVQTGPGIPTWDWRSYHLGFSGPVTADQSFRLWLLPAWAQRSLAWVRIGLLVALGLALWRARKNTTPLNLPNFGKGAAAVGLVLFLLPAVSRAEDNNAAEEIAPQAPSQALPRGPNDELLQELVKRLAAPPGCTPQCVDLSSLKIQTSAGKIDIALEMHAAADVAAPLPLRAQSWLPRQVLLDNQPATLLRTAQGEVWILLRAGVHRVNLTAPTGSAVILPLALKPRHVQIRADGYQVAGVAADGTVEDTLQLTPTKAEKSASGTGPVQGTLPPWAEVTRAIEMGTTWKIVTVVQRRGDANTPLTVEVGALPGEQVLTPGVSKNGERLSVTLAAQVYEYRWTSSLAVSPTLKLTAASQPGVFETWTVTASPRWHLESQGLPVIYQANDSDTFVPSFRPWPGEELALQVSKPEPAPGPSLTLEDVKRVLRPGLRQSETTLTLQAHSSRGQDYVLKLPDGSTLDAVSVAGVEQPARLHEGAVRVALNAGHQPISIRWHESTTLSMLYRPSPLLLGMPAVNIATDVEMPAGRWILGLGGDGIGPALLFWGLVLVLLGVAAALARTLTTLWSLPVTAIDWFLLGLGLSQSSVWLFALCVGWFGLMALRRRMASQREQHAFGFNLGQIALAFATVGFLAIVVGGVAGGLLGTPDMQIEGNLSHASHLRWYSDRIGSVMPSVWVLNLPFWIYRSLMLAWSLWLALRLLRWLQFGWTCFSEGALWVKPPAIAPKKT